MTTRPEATRPPLVFNATVAASPEEVFRLLCAEPERWLCRSGAFEPRTGGRVRLCWGENGCVEGRVVQYVPPSTARFSWRFEGDPLPETMVVFSATPGQREGGTPCTRVEVEHYGFGAGPDWEALYLGSARAWAGYLKNLRAVLEAGVDLREADE